MHKAQALHWTRLRVPIIILLNFMALCIVLKWAGIVYNNSPSEPIGIYWLNTVRHGVILRGDRISFCPPVRQTNFPFLERGDCAGGTTPFIKTIVGIPGDVIDVSVAGVHVNGQLLADSASMRHSISGIALPHAYGVFRLRPGEFWTYGSGMPKYSFDSRYWGVVTGSMIRDEAQLSWLGLGLFLR
jgi:conjugative transfer signal peptidase TraF